MPPAVFALVIFEIGFYVYAWAGLDLNPMYASQVAGMTSMCHYTRLLLVEMGSLERFCLACPGTVVLLIHAS
jgi:hypothetical protein